MLTAERQMLAAQNFPIHAAKTGSRGRLFVRGKHEKTREKQKKDVEKEERNLVKSAKEKHVEN